NIVSDTNCYSLQGITRFAIHFEPTLIPISLLYYIFPTPKTLLVLQTLVVTSGAFPAFWLARLRLRNEWAGVALALLYLLYPAQQIALIFDFHAVTLTSAPPPANPYWPRVTPTLATALFKSLTPFSHTPPAYSNNTSWIVPTAPISPRSWHLPATSLYSPP